MAERVHLIDGGNTRITVKAFKVWWDVGFYIHVSWGGETIREVARPRQVQWWNPFTWGGGTDWVRADPRFNINVQFFDANDREVSGTLPPTSTSETGYMKREVFFLFFGYPRPVGPDARDIRKVTVSYYMVGEGSVTFSQV